MSQARIIINVSNEPQSHANGLSGTFTVPAKKPHEEFGMLVVCPTPEIQDIGSGRKTIHWPKAGPIARDIVGLNSDACAHTPGSPGSREKWGLLLCAAEPDVPRDWLDAQETEIDFLNNNPPDTKMRIDKPTGALVATNVEPVEIQQKKVELSNRVQECHFRFLKECRKLVMKAEVEQAKNAMQKEDSRLVAEGDAIYAGPENGRRDINEIHKRACIRMGQERPWCYIPQNLVDCPGCGAKIKEHILSCPHCAGWLDEGLDELRAMKPKERALKMYPERYTEPVGAKGEKH